MEIRIRMRRFFVFCTILTALSLLTITGLTMIDYEKPDQYSTDQKLSSQDLRLSKKDVTRSEGVTLADAGSDRKLIGLEQNSSENENPVPAEKTSIWISAEELADLDMQGEAWEQLKKQAIKPVGKPNLSNNKQKHNVYILGKALVYVRCTQEPSSLQCSDIELKSFHQEIMGQIMMIMGTEKGGSTLALGRELAAYVIAADLITLSPKQEVLFKAWLSNVRYSQPDTLSRKTLISTHEERPNNWGTHAGASRLAIAVYLNDRAEIHRAATVFKGWLGDRDAYSNFVYRYGFAWQCHANKPVGINPKGCKKEGHSIDGVLPDDQRRGGGFQWPPPKENYVYEALQGALVQAIILQRQGYDPFNWQDKALLRAYSWLNDEANFSATGDDTWQLPLVDCYYATSFWNRKKTRFGKNIGWTGWTHSTNNKGCHK